MKKRIYLKAIVSVHLSLMGCLVNAQTPTYTTYLPNSQNVYAQDNDVTCISFDETTNTVWAGTRAYYAPLKKFDGTSWTSYNDSVMNCIPGEATSVIIDGNHAIWYSTLGGGISKYNGTSFTNSTSTNSGLENNFVTCMEMDNSNNLFLYASNFHQTQKFNGTTWTNLESFSYGVKMSYDSVNNIVWMATEGAGLKKIQNNQVTTFNIGNSSIPDNDVIAITVDPTGAVWLAFDNTTSGLVKFDGSTWTSYTSSNSSLLSNSIGVIKSDKAGNIWIGGFYYAGLTRFDGSNWTSYDISYPNFPSMSIRDFADGNNGILWIATNSGLVKMQVPLGIKEAVAKSGAKTYPNPFSVNTVISFSKRFQNATLKVTDAFGKEVKKANFSGSEFVFERGDLKDGVYFYQVHGDNTEFISGKLIVQ